MKTPKTRTILLASLMAASALLGGCASTGSYGPHYSETVYMAPPPPRVEYVGPPPVIGHVWIAGFWNWGGGRYVWVPGRWEAPRSGQQWVPHHWERDGDRWRQQGGYWEKSHAVVEPARPPAHYEAPRREPDRNERHDRERWDRSAAPAPAPQALARAEPRRENSDNGWRGHEHRDGRPGAAAAPREVTMPSAPPAPRIEAPRPAPVAEAPRVRDARPAPEARRENRSEDRSQRDSRDRGRPDGDDRGRDGRRPG